MQAMLECDSAPTISDTKDKIIFLDPFHDIDDQAAIVAIAKLIRANPSLAGRYTFVIGGEYPAESLLSAYDVFRSICGDELARHVNLVAAPAYEQVMTNPKNVVLENGNELDLNAKCSCFSAIVNHYKTSQNQQVKERMKKTLFSIIANTDDRLAKTPNPELTVTRQELFAHLSAELQEQYEIDRSIHNITSHQIVTSFLCDLIDHSPRQWTISLCAQTGRNIIDPALIARANKIDHVVVQGAINNHSLGGFNNGTAVSQNIAFIQAIQDANPATQIIVVDTTFAQAVSKRGSGIEDLEYPYLRQSALFYTRDKELQWLFKDAHFALTFENKLRNRLHRPALEALPARVADQHILGVERADVEQEFQSWAGSTYASWYPKSTDQSQPDPYKVARKEVIEEMIDEGLMHPLLYGFATDYKPFFFNRYVDNLIDRSSAAFASLATTSQTENPYQVARDVYCSQLRGAIERSNPFLEHNIQADGTTQRHVKASVDVIMDDGTQAVMTTSEWKEILTLDLQLQTRHPKFSVFNQLMHRSKTQLCDSIEGIVRTIRESLADQVGEAPKRRVVLYDVPVALYDEFEPDLGSGHQERVMVGGRELQCTVHSKDTVSPQELQRVDTRLRLMMHKRPLNEPEDAPEPRRPG